MTSLSHKSNWHLGEHYLLYYLNHLDFVSEAGEILQLVGYLSCMQVDLSFIQAPYIESIPEVIFKGRTGNRHQELWGVAP